ncbi:MAG: FecR family protein [Paludibacter sp.]
MKKETDNLLARYFGGNASENDMQMLEEWISTSKENQLYFDQLTSLYQQLGQFDANIPTPDIENARKEFLKYISKPAEIQHNQDFEMKHKPFYKSWMFQAASIALLVILSFSGWKMFFSEHQVILTSQMNPIQEILADNTEIQLAKDSKITYSSAYALNNKILKLEGEANFKVGHSGKGKLQVMADETIIEDIGTIFTVTAYPDSNYISVKVSEGKVRFYTRNNTGLTINASETGIYNKQTKTFKALAHKSDSLKVGLMHIDFQAILLSDAINIISNAYSVKINLAEKSIGNRRITVCFDSEDVNVVLQIIAETLNLNIQKGKTGYIINERRNE